MHSTPQSQGVVEKEALSLCQKLQENLQATKNRLRIKDAWRMVQDSIAKVVIIIEKNIGSDMPGAEKKAIAMNVIEKVVDIVCALIDIPGIPRWIQSALYKYLKKFLLEVADGSIDAIVKTFRETGVFIEGK